MHVDHLGYVYAAKHTCYVHCISKQVHELGLRNNSKKEGPPSRQKGPLEDTMNGTILDKDVVALISMVQKLAHSSKVVHLLAVIREVST